MEKYGNLLKKCGRGMKNYLPDMPGQEARGDHDCEKRLAFSAEMIRFFCLID
jgi:hypothetical protein